MKIYVCFITYKDSFTAMISFFNEFLNYFFILALIITMPPVKGFNIIPKRMDYNFLQVCKIHFLFSFATRAGSPLNSICAYNCLTNPVN